MGVHVSRGYAAPPTALAAIEVAHGTMRGLRTTPEQWSHAVGQLRPNLRGLFDVHGNLYEWCHDWYAQVPDNDAEDPLGAAAGSDRVNRGGGWDYSASRCRSANRSRYLPDDHSSFLGFRVTIVPSSKLGRRPSQIGLARMWSCGLYRLDKHNRGNGREGGTLAENLLQHGWRWTNGQSRTKAHPPHGTRTMIQAIGPPAAGNSMTVRATTSSNASSNASSLAGTNGLRGADELSLSQSAPQALTNATYQRTSLKIRARSEVSTADDGDVRAVKSQARLRFRHEFEAADGTHIRIRFQANLNYAQATDSEDGSQFMRLQAAARVSILQENVSSGTAPLLDTPDISAASKQLMSQALDLFQQVVDATTSAFLDSDPLDGDGLIAGLVDAFNELSASIDSMFLSPPVHSRRCHPAKLSSCSNKQRRAR